MAKTPNEFFETFNGTPGIDIDHSGGTPQCVDGFKQFLQWLGYSNYNEMGYAPSGWAESIWTTPAPSLLANFDRITDYKQFQNGDWIVWPKQSNVFPNSHIAMYWNGQCFGMNQGSSNWNINYPNIMRYASGGFRWKPWQEQMIKKKLLRFGSYVKGEAKYKGYWYYFDEKTHEYVTGFKYIKNLNKTVYYDKQGHMLYGQQKINGEWYCFDKKTGAMFTGIKMLTPSYNKEGYKTVIYDEQGKMLHGKKKFNLSITADKVTGAIIETNFEKEK